MKPYQAIPIVECGESLTAISSRLFSLESPHPYRALGAPYGDRSPYYLRQGVLARLQTAQDKLAQLCPGWRLHVFDAYRPIAVQQFMVDHAFSQILVARQLSRESLLPEQEHDLWQEVYQFWAVPSDNPATPPPHSTGAAVDVTMVEASGHPIAMGGEIDELSPRSYPDYYATSHDPHDRQYHHHRQCLYTVMTHAGFQRHPQEWWHFSYGDQFWAWLTQQQASTAAVACYGGIV